MSDTITGKVKWFNNTKGFGFIDHNGQDAFVHFSQINIPGYKTLKADQDVTYQVESNGPKGLTATNVTPIE